jgi:hypothetical protein
MKEIISPTEKDLEELCSENISALNYNDNQPESIRVLLRERLIKFGMREPDVFIQEEDLVSPLKRAAAGLLSVLNFEKIYFDDKTLVMERNDDLTVRITNCAAYIAKIETGNGDVSNTFYTQPVKAGEKDYCLELNVPELINSAGGNINFVEKVNYHGDRIINKLGILVPVIDHMNSTPQKCYRNCMILGVGLFAIGYAIGGWSVGAPTGIIGSFAPTSWYVLRIRKLGNIKKPICDYYALGDDGKYDPGFVLRK